ncbi:MAG: hypothetical protein PHS77_04805, partial [Gallionellaceae bacterium]|nr:hypothetical protein [Gallionellaceae bacterium]
MPTLRRALASLALLALVAAASLLLSLASGSLALRPAEVWAALLGQGDVLAVQVVQDLRLPR